MATNSDMEPERTPDADYLAANEQANLSAVQPHSLFFTLAALTELRDSLRREFPLLSSSVDIVTSENHFASETDFSIEALTDEVQRLQTLNVLELGSDAAGTIYERTQTLLAQAGHAAQRVVNERYFSRLNSNDFAPEMVSILSDAQAEIMERFAPLLADLCAAVLPSNPLSRAESISFSRAILAHNRASLERHQALPVFDRESAIKFCRTLPDQLFETIGLENIEKFVQRFSTLGGLFLSESVYQAQASWLFMESAGRLEAMWCQLQSLFPAFAPDERSFFNSINPSDRQLLAPLEHDFARAAADGSKLIEAFKKTAFYQSEGTLTTLMAISTLLATDVATQRLHNWGIDQIPPLRSLPSSTSSLADLPDSMLDTLSDEGLEVVNRLARHPQFPAVCVAYHGLGDIFQLMAQPFSDIDRILSGDEEKQFLESEFIRGLLTQIFDTSKAGILPSLPAETLGQDAFRWSLCSSLLVESPGALKTRAALYEHLTSDTSILPEKYARLLLQFAIATYRLQPTDESILLFGPCVFNRQPIAPRPPAIPSVYSPLIEHTQSQILDLSEQTAPQLPALFHEAFLQAHAHGLSLSTVLFSDFIILCAAYPHEVSTVCSLAHRIHKAVDELEISSEERFVLYATTAQLLLAAAHDANQRGIDLLSACFPVAETGSHATHTLNQIISAIELCRPEERPTLLRNSANWIQRSSSWWDSVSSTLHQLGYTKQSICEIREQLRDCAIPYMLDNSEAMLLSWSCLKPGLHRYPSAEELTKTLQLLTKEASTTADHKQSRRYVEFSKLLASSTSANWIEHLSLAQVSSLFAFYSDSHRDRSWNIAPLLHMIASFDRLELMREPMFLKHALAALLQSDIHTQVKEMEHSLAKAIPNRVIPKTPIDILLMSLALGVDHAEFTSSQPVDAILADFQRKYYQGSLAPLRAAWKPSSVLEMPTIGRLKETITDSQLLASLELIGLELESAMSVANPLYGRLRATPPAQLNQDAKGRFLAELLFNKRYFDKCQSIVRTKHPRDKLLRAVEMLSEGLAGGLKDNIKSAEDPKIRAQIREQLGFEVLARYISDEHRRHETAQVRNDSSLRVSFAPTRGVLAEFAGYICDTCLTRTTDLIEKHPDLVFIPFIKHSANSDGSASSSFVGGSLVAQITIRDNNGNEREALMIRGFNPSMALLKKVKTSAVFDHFLSYLSEIATASGISTIVVPRDETWGIALSNRPFVFELIKSRYIESGAEEYSVASVDSATINQVPVHRVISVWES